LPTAKKILDAAAPAPAAIIAGEDSFFFFLKRKDRRGRIDKSKLQATIGREHVCFQSFTAVTSFLVPPAVHRKQ